MVNYAEDAVCGLHLNVECENATAGQSVSEADGNVMQSGLNVAFRLIPEDFSSEIEDGSKAVIRLGVMDQDGNHHEVQGEVYADLIWGTSYRLNLSGSAAEGYFLGK